MTSAVRKTSSNAVYLKLFHPICRYINNWFLFNIIHLLKPHNCYVHSIPISAKFASEPLLKCQRMFRVGLAAPTHGLGGAVSHSTNWSFVQAICSFQELCWNPKANLTSLSNLARLALLGKRSQTDFSSNRIETIFIVIFYFDNSNKYLTLLTEMLLEPHALDEPLTNPIKVPCKSSQQKAAFKGINIIIMLTSLLG